MALTDIGYPGALTGADWHRIAQFLGGPRAVVEDSGDFEVTTTTGDRRVSVAAGSAFGDGVLTTSDAAEVVQLPTGTNVWHTIVLRRDWTTKTSAVTYAAGGAAQTVSANLETDPGTGASDQPLALVQITNNTGAPAQIIDLREFHSTGPRRFSTTSARDLWIPTPALGEQVFVNGGTGLLVHNSVDWQSLAPIAQNADTQITSTSTDWSETSPGGGWTAPASGRVRVRIGALMGNNGTSTTRMGFKIYRNTSASGTVAVDVSNTQLLAHKGQANDAASHERSFIVSGLTPGTVYYSIACYSVTGGTGSWQHRRITIEPLA